MAGIAARADPDPDPDPSPSPSPKPNQGGRLRGGRGLRGQRDGGARAHKGLGFSDAEFDRPCASFSGGWQMRIGLARWLL